MSETEKISRFRKQVASDPSDQMYVLTRDELRSLFADGASSNYQNGFSTRGNMTEEDLFELMKEIDPDTKRVPIGIMRLVVKLEERIRAQLAASVQEPVNEVCKSLGPGTSSRFLRDAMPEGTKLYASAADPWLAEMFGPGK